MKVAIIGCGMISNFAHIPAYRHLPDDFEIVAVCDNNLETAKSTAERHGIPYYTDNADNMLSDISPDIVSVCVPNMFHKRYVEAALNAGAHVICEKPLAVSYADAKELFALAESKKLMLCACQSMRFTPDRIEAKKLIDSGILGDIYYGEFSRIRHRGIPKWGTFHLKEYSGGGAFVDIGVHMLDALVWLMGNPKLVSVSGTTSARIAHLSEDIPENMKASGALAGGVHSRRTYDKNEFDVEDFSSGSILFEGGKRVNFKVAWAANLPDETSIVLAGENAGIKLPEYHIFGGYALEEKPSVNCVNPYPNEEFSGHFALLDNVRDYLNGKDELIVKPEETLAVSAIIDLFYKSASQNKEVFFNE